MLEKLSWLAGIASLVIAIVAYMWPSGSPVVVNNDGAGESDQGKFVLANLCSSGMTG